MFPLRKLILGLLLVSAVALMSGTIDAQYKGGQGKGKDAAFEKDRELFHYLLDHRKDIKRTVEVLPDGVRTLTESNVASVATKIQEHAEAMHKRIKERRPIHQRDPLFVELFRHADKIVMKIEKTEKGVRVVETSKDKYVAKLIQAHAEVVSKFLSEGYSEVRKNHAVPKL